jgi:hypothetical protein
VVHESRSTRHQGWNNGRQALSSLVLLCVTRDRDSRCGNRCDRLAIWPDLTDSEPGYGSLPRYPAGSCTVKGSSTGSQQWVTLQHHACKQSLGPRSVSTPNVIITAADWQSARTWHTSTAMRFAMLNPTPPGCTVSQQRPAPAKRSVLQPTSCGNPIMSQREAHWGKGTQRNHYNLNTVMKGRYWLRAILLRNQTC